LKAFDNTCVLEVDTKRDLFTRHSLYMNPKGKEHMAKKIVMAIQGVLNEKESDPIPVKNKEDLRTDNKGTNVKTTAVETEAKLKIEKRRSYQAMNQKINKQVYTTPVGKGIALKDSTWIKMSNQETILK